MEFINHHLGSAGSGLCSLQPDRHGRTSTQSGLCHRGLDLCPGQAEITAPASRMTVGLPGGGGGKEGGGEEGEEEGKGGEGGGERGEGGGGERRRGEGERGPAFTSKVQLVASAFTI